MVQQRALFRVVVELVHFSCVRNDVFVGNSAKMGMAALRRTTRVCLVTHVYYFRTVKMFCFVAVIIFVHSEGPKSRLLKKQKIEKNKKPKSQK